MNLECLNGGILKRLYLAALLSFSPTEVAWIKVLI